LIKNQGGKIIKVVTDATTYSHTDSNDVMTGNVSENLKIEAVN